VTEPTEYVVLQRTEGIVPRDDAASEPAEEFTGWRPIGNATTHGKAAAIAKVAGERPGAFKAIPLLSWKGGVERTQKTLFDEKPLP
jgi:hypothetical protein